MQFFVAGSHTNIGKTYVSAGLCFAFGFDYFKLIQAGEPTDSKIVSTLSPQTRIFDSGVFLKTPASPHIGKQIEQVCYEGLAIKLPCANDLLIEIAGGLFSPLDERFCMIDYIKSQSLPVVLVGGYYLGAINHILLSIHALKSHKIKLLGLIVSGHQDAYFDAFISAYAGVEIAHFPLIKEDFALQAKALKKSVEAWFL